MAPTLSCLSIEYFSFLLSVQHLTHVCQEAANECRLISYFRISMTFAISSRSSWIVSEYPPNNLQLTTYTLWISAPSFLRHNNCKKYGYDAVDSVPCGSYHPNHIKKECCVFELLSILNE
eukprot:113114_1